MGSSKTARKSLIDAAGAREVSISAGGSTTSALVRGEGNPLLLLHGFNAAAGLVWWPVIPALSKGFIVVVPDLPGLGESEALQGRPNTSRVVEWLRDVIQNGFGEPVTLVATSLSGGFGLRFAVTYPDLLQGLILTDAQGLAPFRPPLGFLIATTSNRLRPSRASVTQLAGYVIHDQEQVRRIHGSLWDTFIGYMVAQTGRREVRQAMSGYVKRGMTRALPQTLLEAIQPPVGMIWGLHDRPFPLSIASRTSAQLAWLLQVIEDAGHLPYLEQPASFVEGVRALTRET